ncbi:MAG: DUF4406 domain-containing protein [Peptococcaceae bacterium]|nr:DUF4406 domain-containing protein [Peptococcaceae bacterium]
MVKVFISQPMRDKTNEEIEEVREQAIKVVKTVIDDEVQVIDSFFKDAPVQAKPLWYLAKSIELLAEADVAVFAPGWKEARGCAIECECATRYGIKVIYLEV